MKFNGAISLVIVMIWIVIDATTGQSSNNPNDMSHTTPQIENVTQDTGTKENSNLTTHKTIIHVETKSLKTTQYKPTYSTTVTAEPPAVSMSGLNEPRHVLNALNEEKNSNSTNKATTNNSVASTNKPTLTTNKFVEATTSKTETSHGKGIDNAHVSTKTTTPRDIPKHSTMMVSSTKLPDREETIPNISSKATTSGEKTAKITTVSIANVPTTNAISGTTLPTSKPFIPSASTLETNSTTTTTATSAVAEKTTTTDTNSGVSDRTTISNSTTNKHQMISSIASFAITTEVNLTEYKPTTTIVRPSSSSSILKTAAALIAFTENTTEFPDVGNNTEATTNDTDSERLNLLYSEDLDSSDSFWPVVMALTIAIPTVIAFGVTITVLYRRRMAKPRRVYGPEYSEM